LVHKTRLVSASYQLGLGIDQSKKIEKTEKLGQILVIEVTEFGTPSARNFTRKLA